MTIPKKNLLAEKGGPEVAIYEPVKNKPGYTKFVKNRPIDEFFTQLQGYLPVRSGFIMPDFEYFTPCFGREFRKGAVHEFMVTVRRGTESDLVSVLAKDAEGLYEVIMGKIFSPLERTWKYVALLDAILSYEHMGSPREKAELYRKLKEELEISPE